ncbi:MAG: hypothetical protein IKR23_01770 [Lachnospiraceae bacterium]|nr:hypothetical protein [Lachnospiraceae bacterium]
MISFEEELKKFHRSPELEDTEEAIFKENLTDVLDIVLGVANSFDADPMMAMGMGNDNNQ